MLEFYKEMLDTYKTQLELAEEGLKAKATDIGMLLADEGGSASGDTDTISIASAAMAKYIRAVYNLREMIGSLTKTIADEEAKVNG